MSERRSWIVAIAFLASCGGATTTTDAGMDAARDEGVDAPADTGVDAPCPDADADGHRAMSCGGDDCDDTDPTAYPGNTEVCDAAGHDEDCDPTTFGLLDVDHDGYVSNACCNTAASGTRTCGDDCNDTDPTTHPTAPEVCDGVDNDCNGLTDDGLPTFDYYPDCDGDGEGNAMAGGSPGCGPPPTIPSCGAATGTWVMSHDDCDDTRADVRPGAVEHCDGLDDDCSGSAETDADRDGHFLPGTCTPTAGETPDDDCDDTDARVHPGADYQTVEHCPSAGVVCPGVLVVGTGIRDVCGDASGTCPSACPAGTCVLASWDYDCSGTVDRAPAAGTAAAPVCPGAVSCGTTDGYYYSGTPACGTNEPVLSCHLTTGVGGVPICSGSATSTPLACR